MKAIRLFLLACFLIPVSSLFSGPLDMIPPGDPILEDLRFLSLESGKSILSFTPPLAPAEIERFLNSLDESVLSGPGLEAYERVQKRLESSAFLSFSHDTFSVLLNINAALEGRVRFNDDIDWHPQHPKIPALLSLPVSFFFADRIQLYIEPVVAAAPQYYSDAKTFGINVPYGYDHFNAMQPLRAYIAAGGSWWNFQLGRDRLYWGTGHAGNLSFSDNSPYFEFARLSFFSDFFKYSLIVNHLPLRVNNDIYDDTVKPVLGTDDLTETMNRNFYLHRIDVSLFKRKVSLGAMEGVIVGNSPLEIRYLNPLMIFHSFFSWMDYELWSADQGTMNGSFFAVEANWHIIQSLSVYGQFMMNQLALPGEKKDSVEPPNGFGFMGGVNFSHSFENWGSSFFIEFILTDPYLYLNSSPFASFIQMNRISAGSQMQYFFLGYPRDTIAITLGAQFFKGAELTIAGEFSWLSRGKHAINDVFWDWERSVEAFEEKTPSGTPENKFTATATVQWIPLSYLCLNGSITGIYSQNNKNSGSDKFGGQASFAVSFRPRNCALFRENPKSQNRDKT